MVIKYHEDLGDFEQLLLLHKIAHAQSKAF